MITKVFIHRLRFWFLVLFICCCECLASAQNGYWQQQLSYTIHVTLNDETKTLDGDEKIVYTNHSPDTLRFIFFHLWMNAYKNDKTAFSEQLLRNNHTDFYFSDEAQRGYINGLRFTVNDSIATLIPDSSNIDIAKLMLPKPLPPNQSIEIATPFHVKLPFNFSRGGYEGQTFQITQWYPKPAVYDKTGWHPMPYLDQGEFYSEFGNWDVSISLPENYTVAASGDLQNAEELTLLKTMGQKPPGEQSNYLLWSRDLLAKAMKLKQPLDEVMPPSSRTIKTLRYALQNAHDFAWFASKLFLVQYDTVQLSSHTVDAFTFYNPWDKNNWQHSLSYVKDAVHFYSDALGEYPYGKVSAVAGNPRRNTGGMEYPTITLIELNDSTEELDATITHEIGHNWLYGILATNERQYPWMDEGINTYYENRYTKDRYAPVTTSSFAKKKFPEDQDTLLLQTLHALHKDQSINTPSDLFTEANYGLVAYSKTGMWLHQLEQQLGTPLFDSAMKTYYRQWQYKHPYPEDFKTALETTSGTSLNSQFAKLDPTGLLYGETKKKVKPTFLFSEKETSKYTYLSFAPAVGYNNYDKFMIGGLVHNYQFPLPRFTFLAAPLYATESKTLNGAARAGFSTFTKRSWLEVSASAIRYNIGSFTQYDNSKLYFGMMRIVPSLKLRLYNKDLRCTQRWTFTARSFLIREQGFGNFTTVVSGVDTFVYANKQTGNRYVNQLRAEISDNRKLYPYDANITIDQGRTFLRAGITGNYYFNFAKKEQGLSARFFAGKFFYLQQKTLLSKGENYPYLLTLSGPHGSEDYTYSDYFIGRSEFDGGLSQQIMVRDGFFKVSTPLLNNPVGKTDDWLLSLNLVSDIPDQINPLKVLPVKLPIQLFADIGTYSDVWNDDNSDGRFLYDAGIKLSIIKSAFNVYLPIVYSKAFRDYYKSFYPDKRFARTISFAFDLGQLQPNKLYRSLPL